MITYDRKKKEYLPGSGNCWESLSECREPLHIRLHMIRQKIYVTPGNNTTEIGEDFPSPTPVVPDKDIDIAKKIWVSNNPSGQNQTGTDCYVRVAVGYSNSDIGKAVTMKNTDSENWIYGDDGFYYYKRSIREGESTTQLCTGFLMVISQS